MCAVVSNTYRKCFRRTTARTSACSIVRLTVRLLERIPLRSIFVRTLRDSARGGDESESVEHHSVGGVCVGLGEGKTIIII